MPLLLAAKGILYLDCPW